MLKERTTKQKMLILSTVCASKAHPTAEQVYDMLKNEMPGLSLGTVYRNLNRMAELGQIRRLSVTNSPDRFDGDLRPHHHICCSACGDFSDYFNVSDESAIDAQISIQTGFEIQRHETVFYGICPKCRACKQ
ncbi:MAG: transcriptional repressor [Clostridia bacterium]|nr:transcriptional repressor [Clostridia bacterium]MBQ9847755.1 transcriptional repressor [Clostridia bacterium]